MVLPISPVANITLAQRPNAGLIDLPGFSPQPQVGQAQQAAPVVSPLDFGPLPVPQPQGPGGLPLVAAGLSLLSGQGDPGQAIINLISGQRQAQQDALKFELLRREEARKQQQFSSEQAVLAQQAQARQEVLADIQASDLPANTKMAAEFLVESGDTAGLAEFLQSVANRATFTPVQDAQGNIVGQQDSLTGKIVEDPRAQRALTIRGQDITRRGQDLRAATARRGQDLRASVDRNARARKIEDTMSTFGVDRQQATKLVDGLIRVVPDPTTGENRFVDVIERTEQPAVAQSGAQGPQAAPAEAVSTAEQSRGTVFEAIEDAYGAGSVAADIVSATVGQFIEGANSPRISQARTRAGVLREELITALSKSGRPPVVEQQRILENLPSLGVFESAPRAAAKLSELHSQLRAIRIDDLEYAARRDVPPEGRKAAFARAKDIKRVMELLGTPPSERPAPGAGNTSAQNPAQPSSQAEFDALPSGAFFINPSDGQLRIKD